MPNIHIPKKFLAISLVVILFSLLIFTTIFLGSKTTRKPPPETKSTGSIQYTDNPPDKIIAKVGEENIYQKDLDTELSYYPSKDEEAKKILLNKIIEDSKILQIAREENILPVENNVYNSPDKEYMNRISTVINIKEELKKRATHLKGKIISVWFLNDHVGPLGYNKAKALANTKIADLHQMVVNKQITIDQAGKQIKSDTSFAILDPMYQENAFIAFDATPGARITWEDDFDKRLWGGEIGEVTEIFTGKSYNFDSPDKEKVEAYYLFGQVDEKISENSIADLDQWIAEKSQKYEVKYL